MANYGPADAFLLVGGNNLSTETFSLDEGVEQLSQESRGLGVTMDEYKPVGVGKVSLDATPGLYSDRDFGQIAALESNQATRKLVSYGFWGDAIGSRAVMIDGLYSMVWKRQLQRDGLTLAGMQAVISGTYYGAPNTEAGLGGPRILHGIDSESGSGTTEATSVDNAASSASGIVCDLHIPALDLGGGTNVVVTVQDSPDNAVWTLLGTFTAVTSETIGTSERITVAGTIDRYLSITWTFTGGAAQTVTPYVVAYRN